MESPGKDAGMGVWAGTTPSATPVDPRSLGSSPSGQERCVQLARTFDWRSAPAIAKTGKFLASRKMVPSHRKVVAVEPSGLVDLIAAPNHDSVIVQLSEYGIRHEGEGFLFMSSNKDIRLQHLAPRPKSKQHIDTTHLDFMKDQL